MAADGRELSTRLRDEGQSPSDAEWQSPSGSEPSLGLDTNGDPIIRNEFGLPIIWTYRHPVQPSRPRWVQAIRDRIFKIFMAFIFGGTIVALVVLYHQLPPQPGEDITLLGLKCSKHWRNLAKYLSIPLVSVLFTWWHVWLGIQMCFYPVEFFPQCGRPVFGWQGIVPRRARIMAERACDIMIGKLLCVPEIIAKIESEPFFEELNSIMSQTAEKVLVSAVKKEFPTVHDSLGWNKTEETKKQQTEKDTGDKVKEEIVKKIMELGPKMFEPVLSDVKGKIEDIIDFKTMSVEILQKEKAKLVQMFQDIGEREFTFVQHFSAVLGFILGVFQMLMWVLINAGHDEAQCKQSKHSHEFHCWAGFVLLPVSGLIIGYLTNWLGINLIFRPVWPHPFCGGYVNFQGVFLKRQVEVAGKMSTRVCEELVNSARMFEYVKQHTAIQDKVMVIFRDHVQDFTKRAQGSDIISGLISTALRLAGLTPKEFFNAIQEDVISGILEDLNIEENQLTIQKHMDKQFALRDMLSERLSKLPPDLFEGMLHPVFQEDEWMVLLLGGVLGVLVGTMQAFALGS